MMIMTAKVDLKKIAMILGAVAAVIVAIILFFGGGEGDAQTTSATVTNNESRIKFLQDFGWDVTNTPKESSQVKIPENATEAFDRYNTLQKNQGFDLKNYAGKNVMRYVYQINNYPGATDPVYATLLVHKNQIIGGDITDTSPSGKVQGFKMPKNTTIPATSPTTPDA